MSRMPRVVGEGRRSGKARRLGRPRVMSRDENEGMELDSRLKLERELVPLGSMHVRDELDAEARGIPAPAEAPGRDQERAEAGNWERQEQARSIRLSKISSRFGLDSSGRRLASLAGIGGTS